MKKSVLRDGVVLVWLLLISLIFLVSGCKKDNIAPAQTNSNNTVGLPIAQPLEDFSTAGVYKGVLAGSHSGNFIVWIDNGDNAINAMISYNNVLDTLSTQDLLGWQPGEPVSAAFTGRFGSGLFTLNVNIAKDSTGAIVFSASATNTSESSDNNILAVGLKEISTILVKVYEGTYTGTAKSTAVKGKWNYVLKGSQLAGIVKDNTAISTGFLGGQNGNGAWKIGADNGTFNFGLSNTYMNGLWSGSNSNGSYQVQQTN